MKTKTQFPDLSPDQEKWVQTRAKRYKLPRMQLRILIKDCKGLCMWSGIPLLFGKKDLNPPTNPIAAVLEHNEPKSDKNGHSIVCHYLNDTKGKMPHYLWESFRKTTKWKAAMKRMKKQADKDPIAFDKIINAFKNEH